MKFTSIGDCCIDIYSKEKKSFLGGGAFNVAYFAKLAGAKVHIISSVGKDAYGESYLHQCKQMKIDTKFLECIPGKTSTIEITLHKTTPEYGAWDLGVLKGRLLRQDEKKILLTQDIAHGILFTPIEDLFRQFCTLGLPNTLKIGDFSAGTYSQSITAIDTYAKGLDVFVKSMNKTNTHEVTFFKDFAKKNKKICIALLGDKGSIVFAHERVHICPALAVNNVVDTSGAGDAYIANFAYVYIKTKNIPLAMKKATSVAAHVIGRLGVTGEEIYVNSS